MRQRLFLVPILFLLAAAFCFGQAGALRDYVGLISIHYHPDVVNYMGKFRDAFEKKGYSNAAKSIDNYLKGLSGSGFIYVAPDGTNYVLTNEHVVAQSESLSIVFEKQDGSKISYDRLRVLFVDEEKDLAILVFDGGIKPFTQGLSLSTVAAEEGADVFAAGFPGLGNAAIWQFSRGTVSNAIARIPKDNNSDETLGPYVQHTSQIDPGNSGGPLLVAVQGVPTGYAVVGINTLSATRRQAANYAIPVDQVKTFIAASLSTEPVNERELIAKKADDFLKGLNANKAVYDHIAAFLSNNCTASNAEYAISELLDKAPKSVMNDIDKTFVNDPVNGMNAAVAWNIENSMRSKSGAIKISLDSIEPNDKGGYNIVFNVNGALVRSEWIKEYGVYRMDTYGDTITGNKTLLEDKQKKKEQNKNLRTEFGFGIYAGYAHVFDYGSAFNASLIFAGSSPFIYDIQLIMGQKGYFQLGFDLGFNIPIRTNGLAFMPFGMAGFHYISTDATKAGAEKFKNSFDSDLNSSFSFAFGLSLKGGLMFTTSAVPGLFGQAFFNYNLTFFNSNIDNVPIVGIGIGYAF